MFRPTRITIRHNALASAPRLGLDAAVHVDERQRTNAFPSLRSEPDAQSERTVVGSTQDHPLAKQFPSISNDHRAFILRQHVFFVASAASGTRVNVSPRGVDSLRLLGLNRVAYLDRTGSGNETAAHIRAGGRMTIMFCAFEGPPSILRLYGYGTVHHRRSRKFARLLAEQFGGKAPLGTRQIVSLDIDLVQTSCGFGVPFFDYQGERTAMDKWANATGEAGIDAYWREKNVRSIDGLPTGLFEDEKAPV